MRILSLGWGVQSWTLAAMIATRELPPIDYAIHADTTHEASGTYHHAREWTPWLEDRGVKVVTVRGKRTDVLEQWRNSSSVLIPAFTTDRKTGKHGQVRRQCTYEWKIMPIRAFIRNRLKERHLRMTPGAVTSLQGISLDEYQRMRDSDVAYIVNEYPLVEARITRKDCISWLESHCLPVPPKSACTFCPYHGLAAWKTLKRQGGQDWTEAVAVDEAIRNKRPIGDLFVHPARRPLEEAIRIPEDVGATQLSLDDVPCDGGSCFV
mgnify:CR=1 FL=1